VRRALLALSFGLCAVAPAPARADGSLVVASGEAGPFRVDLLVAALPLRVGATGWSALVRDIASDEVVHDAELQLELHPATGNDAAVCGTPGLEENPASGSDTGVTVLAMLRTASAMGPLPSARIELGAVGDWIGVVRVRRSDLAGELAFRVEVAPAAPPLLAHAWAFALPVLALSVFALHQWLSRHDPVKRTG